jgi:hypothetical protein
MIIQHPQKQWGFNKKQFKQGPNQPFEDRFGCDLTEKEERS